MEQWQKEDSKICLHSHEDIEENIGAVAPPIFQTSLFSFKNWDKFLEGITSEREHYVYTRGVNPTVKILEDKLAQLERGEKCKCFASGIAAISATIFTLVKKGDHILFVNNIYGPAVSYADVLEKFDVEYTNIFIDDASEIENHIKSNTRLIYLESPSTMNFDVIDLRKAADIAKSRNILTAIDNTWATPLYQKPIIHGIDIVLHSCTKFIAGHSDTLGGAVISSYDIVDEIFKVGHQFGGAVLGPIDAWLTLRGLRTLRQRLGYQKTSVEKIVGMLKDNPKINKINHPLLLEGDKKKIYEKQTCGYTSLLSIDMDFKDYDELRDFMNSFKVFKLGVSWGGFESLITSANYNKNSEDLEERHISNNLIRIYIGLEDTEILMEDLENAFKTLSK
ncbi:MAG: aminotransferase class I/II-fold pyridoxal phosphate-dependent enzyme [Tissierella sp.]|nr:aminotransferase class I/II-fold pyridoxal phosphate-dependent enzyme [Tissierella sp.]